MPRWVHAKHVGVHWAGAVASFKGGLDATSFDLTVIELDGDCTGKLSATFRLVPGQPPVTVVERVIVFDNGRQYRAIPVSGGGISTLTWINEGHRNSKPGEPPSTCGPQTAAGRVVLGAENLVQFYPSWPLFSDVVLLTFDVSMTGDFTGTLYEKLGPYGGIVLPATGTIHVNPDCSFRGELNLTIAGKSTTGPIRGVFFDQGKKSYVLNMNPQFSFAQGERIDL